MNLDKWSKHHETNALNEILGNYGFAKMSSKSFELLEDEDDEEESNEKATIIGSGDVSGEIESDNEEQQAVSNNKFSALENDC